MANDKDFKIKNGLQLGGAFIEKVGTIAGNATLDLSTGNVFDYTPTADATFVFSNTGETEHSFVLSVTGADIGVSYDLANASYDGVSFSVAAEDSDPQGVFFKPDGLKMYVMGRNGDAVDEYDLSTAWDISTASFFQNFSVAAQETSPSGIFFKPDGLKMYVIGQTGVDVNEYNLSTAWDVSAASFVQSFSVATETVVPSDVAFKLDGTRMYVLSAGGSAINEYSLSTAWDVSTATYLQNFSVATQETTPQGLFFKPDGLKMYLTGNTGRDVNEYALSTAWNISTASFVRLFSVAAQETVPTGLFFGNNGAKMYVIGNSTDTVFQYSTGTGPDVVTLTYPASVYWPSGTVPVAPAVYETDILEFSTTDGGTVWYGTRAGDAMA